MNKSHEQRIADCLDIVKKAHPQPVRLREGVPSAGMVRLRNARYLVARGLCEWVDFEDSIRLAAKE